MIQKLAIAAIAATLVGGTPALGKAAEPAVQEVDGAEIVRKFIEKVQAFAAKYPGNYSKRDVKTRYYDPDDGELQKRKDFVVEHWEFEGEKPTRKFLSCTIDGEQQEPDDCREDRESEPPHNAFGPDGDKYYKLEYGGVATWDGRDAYTLRIIPREDTDRHVKGTVYFTRDTLDLAGMEITIASYPFPIEDFRIKQTWKDTENGPVVSKGELNLEIYIPLLVHTRVAQQFTVSDQRLLTEGERSAPKADGGAPAS